MLSSENQFNVIHISVFGGLWLRVLAAVLWFGESRDVFAASYVAEMARSGQRPQTRESAVNPKP